MNPISFAKAASVCSQRVVNPRSGYLCIVPNNPQLSSFSSGWGATLQRDHATRQDAAVFSLDANRLCRLERQQLRPS